MSEPSILQGVIGVVIAVMMPLAAALVAFIFGGFKCGYLQQKREVALRPANLAEFSDRLQNRLAEIGFAPTAIENEYLQGHDREQGQTSTTHARKFKILNIETPGSGDGGAVIKITVRFKEFIISDTGESKYLKALLDYVVGDVGQMAVVPNRSLMGLTSLINGMLVFAAAVLLSYAQVQRFWFLLTIVGIVGILGGISGIRNIRAKPGELVGVWESSIGVVLGIAGLAWALTPVAKDEVIRFIHKVS